jgi:glycosyltransferase involved in cell wall biosynthesis
MPLSIITPHYNNFDGLIRIYNCLKNQTSDDWEWIIVDDFSDENAIFNIKEWIRGIEDHSIRFIENEKKSNASVCRNKGADATLFENLVFLDADDFIAIDFVTNRNIAFEEFAIFPNYHVVDDKGDSIKKELKNKEDLLNKFLSAQFLWQTSCVLWDKNFFNSIGQFHPKLTRLQDVELVIRALQRSKFFLLIDNTSDFYYHIKPIRERHGFVKPVCESVNLFISELLDTTKLNKHQKNLLSAYYFLCAKYFERSESIKDVAWMCTNLKLFYNKKYISTFYFILGSMSLIFYTLGLFSGNYFLRVNRYLFKPQLR